MLQSRIKIVHSMIVLTIHSQYSCLIYPHKLFKAIFIHKHCLLKSVGCGQYNSAALLWGCCETMTWPRPSLLWYLCLRFKIPGVLQWDITDKLWWLRKMINFGVTSVHYIV